MAASTQLESGGSSESGPQPRKSAPVATALKWVGAAAAVVSLMVALNQITGLVQNLRIHHAEFSEAMKAGEQQQERGDYPAAFDSFKRATELDPIDRKAQQREAGAAMLWLENARSSDKSFIELTNQLVPVLDKALTDAKGPEAADILAHVGWAHFLCYHDGSGNPEAITKSYQDAVKLDPHNPYANAMWGHWILWQMGDAKEAKEHFTAALESGRVRPYVRRLQLSGYSNRVSAWNQAELLRIANEMRRQDEPLGLEQRSKVIDAFDPVFGFQEGDDPGEFARILRDLQPDELLATYDWLMSGDTGGDLRLRREFIKAFSLEVAGQPSEALSAYKSLQHQLGTGSPYFSLSVAVNNAVKRLSDMKAK